MQDNLVYLFFLALYKPFIITLMIHGFWADSTGQRD